MTSENGNSLIPTVVTLGVVGALLFLALFGYVLLGSLVAPSSKDIQNYAAILQSGDLGSRREAAEYFATLDERPLFGNPYKSILSIVEEKALSALITASRDEDATVRRLTVKVLVEIGAENENVGAALNDALNDSNPWVRYYASAALSGYGYPNMDLWDTVFSSEGLDIILTGSGSNKLSSYDQTESGHHPVIIVYKSENITRVSGWTLGLPVLWLPETIYQTQLIAFVSTSWVESGSRFLIRRGTDRSYFAPEYRDRVEVILKEARSGVVVSTEVFLGPEPHGIGGVVSDVSAFYGESVSLVQVKKWLRRYVVSQE